MRFDIEFGPVVWNQLTTEMVDPLRRSKKHSAYIIYGENFEHKSYSDDVTFVKDNLVQLMHRVVRFHVKPDFP